MMTPCPICQKPVDTLRARNVAVQGVKVVAYCSPECKAKAAGQPVPLATPRPAELPVPQAIPIVVLPVPKSGPVAKSGPVTKSGSTPAGGAKVTDAKSGPHSKVKSSLADYDSGPVIEIVHEPVSGVVTSARDERTPIPPADPLDRTDRNEEPAGVEKVKAKDSVSASGTTEIDPREFLPADDEGDEDDEDDEGGEGSVGTSNRSGIRRRRDSHDAKMAHDWLDDEPADVRPSTESEQPSVKKGRGGVWLLLVLLLLAAGGVAVYKFVYLPRGHARAKIVPPVDKPAMGVVPGSVEQIQPGSATTDGAVADVGDPSKAALERALGVLRRYLATKDSLRVQRQSALALARTGDAAAVERLQAALDKDKLEEAARLEIAYALARAGNQRGVDMLVAALGAPRRDDKLAAARMLTQLGDQRAVATLASFLEVSQHRLGAAELLARFSEPRAIAALEQVRADDKASEDQRAAATIALVVAGKRDLAPDVRKLLDDTRFNVFAADALAGIHDEAARPVLEKQLELSQLRTGAARNLRRLAPDHAMTDHVKRLVVWLDDPEKQRDTEQITTAEALLLLAGPASWAERK